jgi:myo-inositol 2-dehydrogenase/D-chiro-inositol 1-dehydrogenase
LRFFIERYAASYVRELADFVDAVSTGRAPSITLEDGRRALALADAAVESAKTGRSVRVD